MSALTILRTATRADWLCMIGLAAVVCLAVVI
jgi:hypothetical protein